MQKKSRYPMFLILLIGVATMLSGCWNRTPEERAEHITQRLASELDLTADQSTQVKQGVSKLVEKSKELRDIRDSMSEELVKQLRQNQVDRARLNAVVDANKAKLESMLNLLLDEFSQLHQTLTPEQRAQAAERIEKFQDRHSHRRSWFG